MYSASGLPRKSYVEFLRAAGCAITLLAAAPTASAANYQWDANGATAGLGGAATANPTGATSWDLLGTGLDDGTDATVASNVAADSYYFGGLTGTGTAGAINNNGGYTFAGLVYFTIAGYTLQDTGANGDIVFSKMVTIGGSGRTTFAATGAGVGDFKFNGGLTVNSGAIARIGVRFNGTSAISSVASLTGAGDVEFYGSNAHQLSGANTGFTGTAKIESATLRLMNFSSLAGATLNYVGGALSFNAGTGTYNLGGLTGTSTVTLNGNSLSIGAKNVDTSFSGILAIGTGGGGVTKVGTATLTLSNAGNTYSGGTTLSAGILNFANGALSNTGNVTLNGGTLQWATGNTQDLSARFVMVNAKTATLDTNGNDVTLATGFGGSTTGGLTKIGSGALTISGTNTYTGTTTVSNGRLNLTGVLASEILLNAGTVSGTGSTSGLLTTAAGTSIVLLGGANTTSLTTNGVTFAGATGLDFVGTPNLGTTYDVITYGSGSVTNLANLTSLIRGTLSSSGNKITFTTPDAFLTRTWNTTSGTWSIGGAASFAEGDQTFYNTDNVVFGALATDSTITLSGSLKPTTVTVSNSTNVYTFAGTAGSSEIAAFSSLVKNNAGTLILSSAHSYTGGTTVNGGILQLGAGGAGAGFATNGSYTVNNGGTLRIYQGSGTVVAPTWASITGAGVLALNKDGSGSTNKDWGNAALGVGFTGTLWVEEGRVQTTNGASFGGATEVVIEAGAQLGAWNGGTFTPNITIAGTGWGESGYEVAIRGGNGGITSTFSGGITLAANASIGAGPTGFLQVDGAVSGASGVTLTVGTTSLNGTVTLAGNNTYTGNTNIVSGTFKVGSAGKLGTGNYAGNISNAGTLLYSSSEAQTLSGVISGAGALTKDTGATSKLTLTGANTYSGVTTVSAGTLEIAGSSSGASRFIIQGTVANDPILNITANAGAINTLASAAFIVAGAANTTGTVNMAGGTLTANHELWLGDASASANGKFYLTGG
ncbi:MAG TPA: hypothetical protein DCY41_05875, partial [Opitutae bacterium]|nr:hypothetical protein [Opitutae bacterium]